MQLPSTTFGIWHLLALILALKLAESAPAVDSSKTGIKTMTKQQAPRKVVASVQQQQTIEVPLNIRIQLMPAGEEADGSKPSPKFVAFVQTGNIQPFSANAAANSGKQLNREATTATADQQQPQQQREHFGGSSAYWAPDPSLILALIAVAFFIYFFGSLWFFCTFLAPVRASFPSAMVTGGGANANNNSAKAGQQSPIFIAA